MRRIFIFALLALTTAGGVAGADSYRHRDSHYQRWDARNQRGGVYTQRTYPRQNYRQRYNTRVVVQPRVHVVRRPIYFQRPVIQYRYRNYYQRPALIVENQQPMPGYIYVAGQWQWNGYEWIWQVGHYQPDPAYYNDGYENAPNTYDQGTYYDQTPSSYDSSYYNNGY